MNRFEFKEFLISALDPGADSQDISSKLDSEGVSYDFKHDFTDAILARIVPAALKVTREIEYAKYMVFAFRSIAISGIAAIIVLLISIFIREGSISLNSILGLRDNWDESIVYLLTGN